MTTFKRYLKEQQFLTNHDEIAAWLNDHRIGNYTINSDNTVDVHGNVSLNSIKLKNFPFQFGTVNGFFDIDETHLTSLQGCPIQVNGDFYCGKNPELTSLDFLPKLVARNLHCDGVPSYIGINSCEHVGGGIFYSNMLRHGGLGLVLMHIGSDVGPANHQHKLAPLEIIKKYLNKPDLLFDCQAELIEAGFEEYAVL